MKHAARIAPAGLAVLASFQLTPALANDLEFTDNNIPIVLTPTRLRQSLADVPASVTIITADMIQRFGITSVPDALRLVPGMAVTQASGNDYRVNFHGTNILVPRRMNVLVDGMSVYRSALARVDWKELPVLIEDIDRIEVTRGPNSAAYGANSMLAIVNIITKHPKEAEGTTFAGVLGSQRTAEGMVRFGGKIGDSTAFRLTAARQSDNGLDFASSARQGHDSTRLNKLNFRSTTDLAHNESLDFEAAFIDGAREVESVDRFQRTFPDMQVQEYYFNSIWRKSISSNHDIQIQAYASRHKVDQDWTTCVPTAMMLPEMFNMWAANRGYANTILAGRVPTGGTAHDNALAVAALGAIRALGPRATAPTCVDPNQDYVESRRDVELQDTYVVRNTLRVVSGIGARQDVGNSQTFLGGRVSNFSYRAFTNIEYKPSKELNFNVGGYLERDHLTGSDFSPRAAVNYHLADNHTLRFVVSRGTRMPDIQEQRANWRYHAVNFSSPINGTTEGYFFQNARAPGNADSEKILSREIGYLGNLQQYGLLIDARVFDDKLWNLISEKLQLSDFSPTNGNSVSLRGAEMQINYAPSDTWSAFLAYAYLHNADATTELEKTQYSSHSGAIGISRSFDHGWRASLASYRASGQGASQSSYDREDLTISKSSVLGKDTRLTTSLIIRHLGSQSVQFFQDFGRSVESRFSRSMQYYVAFKLTY